MKQGNSEAESYSQIGWVKVVSPLGSNRPVADGTKMPLSQKGYGTDNDDYDDDNYIDDANALYLGLLHLRRVGKSFPPLVTITIGRVCHTGRLNRQ